MYQCLQDPCLSFFVFCKNSFSENCQNMILFCSHSKKIIKMCNTISKDNQNRQKQRISLKMRKAVTTNIEVHHLYENVCVKMEGMNHIGVRPALKCYGLSEFTLQETWLEFLWCRERLQWKSGMPRIGVGDAQIKINEKGQKFLFV